MLKLFLSISFAVLTRKTGIFARRDVQKGTAAYKKESNESETYILLVGVQLVLKIERLVSPIEMYRHVTISLVIPMTCQTSYDICLVKLTNWNLVTSLAWTTVLIFFFPAMALKRHRLSSGSGDTVPPAVFFGELPAFFFFSLGVGFVRPLSDCYIEVLRQDMEHQL